MDTKELKELSIALMDAVKQRGVSVFEVKTDDFKLHIELSAVPTAAASTAQQTVTVAAAAPQEETGTPVEAPLVGVFYSAPAPEEPPFIEVGQQVKKGETLFIIEAMKTMNEIVAPCDGTISRILAQNGDMVEYKQVLVVIE
ncbi:MAG: acetyl-CoA carboxylase, biotin carboxyl carrier protein [Butyricicoccus pullicaecorum]|nr:acetyl-CoA carboxylase, biotin carboxyl carrier protein [Butyricicoccus pullicaecorum]